MDFVVQGAMIGGVALVAAPADYKITGVNTFIVSHDGIVYEKDLGPKSLSWTWTVPPDIFWRTPTADPDEEADRPETGPERRVRARKGNGNERRLPGIPPSASGREGRNGKASRQGRGRGRVDRKSAEGAGRQPEAGWIRLLGAVGPRTAIFDCCPTRGYNPWRSAEA